MEQQRKEEDRWDKTAETGKAHEEEKTGSESQAEQLPIKLSKRSGKN